MPHWRRSHVAIAASLVLAACTTGGPTATRIGSPEVSPAPTAVSEPATSPTPGAGPTITPSFPDPPCPQSIEGYAYPPEIELLFEMVHGAVPGSIESVSAPVDGLLRPLEPGLESGGLLIGGRELPAELRVWYALDPSDRVIEPTLKLTSIDISIDRGNGHEVPVKTHWRLEGARYELTIGPLPDVDDDVTFAMHLAWTDRCYAYTASGSATVQVVSLATVGTCAVTGDAVGEQLATMLTSPLRLGPASARLGVSYVDARYADTPGGDGPQPWDMFDATAAPVVSSPSASLSMTWAERGFTLSPRDGVDVAWYRRGALLEFLAAGSTYGDLPVPPVVFHSPLTQAADGSFPFQAPPDPGQYVAGFAFDFSSPCYAGSAVAGIGVDVE
jgi:hypothetical protein